MISMSAKEPIDVLIGVEHPMFKLSSPKLTKKEKVLKREVDAYLVSDVRETARILIGQKAFDIVEAIDLPDEMSEGLIFKMRLVQMKNGNCYLLARWKPERHMRRNTGGLSQKWFLEKEVFPPNTERFLTRMQQKAGEEITA
jgi:hypothetical protein